MISASQPDSVLSALGDKFLMALVAAVDGAREDLTAMRQWNPSWFPPMSNRCLANIIHDRLWARMLGLDEDDPSITMHEAGVTREIVVGQFRIRLKRHHTDDNVSNYPTQTALDFWVQDNNGVLPGLEEITLAAGYRWDRDLKSIEAPVISYRDGQENVIWSMELLADASANGEDGDGATNIKWTSVGPELPTIEISGPADEEAGEDGV